MSKVLPLIVIGGAAVWAYQKGHLAPVLDALSIQSPAATLDTATGQGASVVPASVAKPLPAKTGISPYEALLMEHDLWVSGWAAQNRELVAAIMRTENRSMDPNAKGPVDEWGVMQVRPGTAEWMYNNGYTRLAPTQANLRTERGGIYFGTGFLDYMARRYPGKSQDWLIRAYNGGPGWEGSGADVAAKTANYLATVKKNLRLNREEYGQGVVA